MKDLVDKTKKIRKTARNMMGYVPEILKNEGPLTRLGLLGRISMENPFKNLTLEIYVRGMDYLFDKGILSEEKGYVIYNPSIQILN